MTEQEIAKMRVLKRRYSELFNEQEHSARIVSIIMSEFAEIALLEHQAKEIELRLEQRISTITGLHKKYLTSKK